MLEFFDLVRGLVKGDEFAVNEGCTFGQPQHSLGLLKGRLLEGVTNPLDELGNIGREVPGEPQH